MPVNLASPKFENLGLTALGNEDVRRLDVPMHDPFRVRGIERIGHFDGQREQGLGVHGLAGDAMLQRDPIQKLHGDKRLAVLLANVVDRADVGGDSGRKQPGLRVGNARVPGGRGQLLGAET